MSLVSLILGTKYVPLAEFRPSQLDNQANEVISGRLPDLQSLTPLLPRIA